MILLNKIGWALVALVGAVALGMIATVRGERVATVSDFLTVGFSHSR